MNKILRAFLTAVGVFALILVILYLKAKISGGAFDPNWATTAGLSVIAGVLSVFGPDAEQRKKNREELANKFKGKKK